MSGKTILNKRILAPWYKRRGIPVIVLDPMLDQEWPADFMTANADEFLALVTDPTKCRQAALFVDEGGMSLTKDDKFNVLTTTVRHYGHVTHLISHKGTNLTPTLRENCSTIFCFRISDDYARDLAKDFAAPQIRDAAHLPAGEFIKADSFGECIRGRVF